ncbi:Serine/threonine-protein kinase 25 [Dinochytrium kinnereticum]|nr:Serine/threonine-protein kinase 25 [Dinochytrium kinnereticum]
MDVFQKLERIEVPLAKFTKGMHIKSLLTPVPHCVFISSNPQLKHSVNKNSNEVVAIKILDLDTDDDEISDVQKEISVLSRCDSEHITRYHGSYLMGTKLWIVMDFAAGGSLRSILKSGPLEERYIAVIAREVLLALVYLHKSANVIHRDIKAANILLTGQGKVKLCDFGVAGQVSMHSLRRHSFVGTPYWMAPEIIKRAQYDFKADVWSLGITIIELATGNPPFADQDPRRAIFLIPRSRPARLEGNFSAAIKEFISLCLNEEPEERPSAEDLLKSRFIRMALRGTDCLLDILKRHETWKMEHPELANEYNSLGIEDDEDSDGELGADDEWVFETLRSSYISLRRSSTKRSIRSVRSSHRVPSSVEVAAFGLASGVDELGDEGGKAKGIGGTVKGKEDEDDDKGTIRSSILPAIRPLATGDEDLSITTQNLHLSHNPSQTYDSNLLASHLHAGIPLDPLPPTPILPITPDGRSETDDFATIKSVDKRPTAVQAHRRRHERSASYGGGTISVKGLVPTDADVKSPVNPKPEPASQPPESPKSVKQSAQAPHLPHPTTSPLRNLRGSNSPARRLPYHSPSRQPALTTTTKNRPVGEAQYGRVEEGGGGRVPTPDEGLGGMLDVRWDDTVELKREVQAALGDTARILEGVREVLGVGLGAR